MKAPKPKIKASPALIDSIGKKYEDGKKLQADGGKMIETAKNDTYALLGKDQAEASAKGTKFEIGFYTRRASPQFDPELFKDLFPADYAKCLVTKTVFDEEMLMNLVKKKKIKEEHFNAAIVRPQGSQTIDIKRLGK